MSSSGAGGKSGLQAGPFEYGPSQYDIGAIMNATGQDQNEIAARYAQLGMGGSTPEQTDLNQQNNLAQAAEGQLQTPEVTQPAFNPALQPASTNQQGTVLGSAIGGAAQGAANLLKAV